MLVSLLSIAIGFDFDERIYLVERINPIIDTLLILLIFDNLHHEMIM